MSSSLENGDRPTERGDRCNVDGGCNYLGTLSKWEELVGSKLRARYYGMLAAQCGQRGCWTVNDPNRTDPEGTSWSEPIEIRPAPRLPGGMAASYFPRAADIVPFSRSKAFRTLSDNEGNLVELRDIKLGRLAPTESLGYLYNYWRSLRRASCCQIANVGTTHLINAGIVGKLHVVDVSSSDPGDFRFELYGYSIPIGPIDKPSSHPVRIWGDMAIGDYNTARMTGAPKFQLVRGHICGVRYHYKRLILPFLDKRGRVIRLAVAVSRERGDGMVLGPVDVAAERPTGSL